MIETTIHECTAIEYLIGSQKHITIRNGIIKSLQSQKE